jgi:hypothetical protein
MRQPRASGLTTGILEAIDVAAQTIRVGSAVFHLTRPELLQHLEVGQRVTVTWDEAGETRRARTIVIERQ